MIQEDLDGWDQFERRLRELKAERAESEKRHAPALVSSFLFRGHEDQRWTLQTTLERIARRPWSCINYYRIICRTKPEIETFTGLRWEIENPEKLTQWWSAYDSIWQDMPAYDYLIYLRQHGFPSPLLDWTRSPYIAAYFAFAQPRDERVAIYAYTEYPEGFKSSSSNEPQIRGLGPYIRSHRRHFLQQSEYTFSAQFIDDKWTFVCHEDVFARGREGQDRLRKFTLPVAERCDILRRLERYNLNAFSLFGTEEALLRTLSVRNIDLSAG